MKRLKLTYSYHDGLIKTVRYRDNSDVILEIDLCGCGNSSSNSITLSILGLRNFTEVHEILESTKRKNSKRDYFDEIVGIVRDDERGYLFDLATSGAVRFDAQGLFEA